MACSGGHCPLWVWGGILCSDRGQSCDAFQAILLEETSPRCNNYRGGFLMWARCFVVNWNIRHILGYIKREHISLPDNVTLMKIYSQMKKKLQFLLYQIPRTCHVFTRLFTSNTPWYFLDFAYITAKSKTEILRGVRNWKVRKQDKFRWNWSYMMFSLVL